MELRLEQSKVNPLYYNAFPIPMGGCRTAVRIQVDDGGYNGHHRQQINDEIVRRVNAHEELLSELTTLRDAQNAVVNVVFDGPPSHEPGRFVEVELDSGRSVKCGEWVRRDDGYWCLRISAKDILGASQHDREFTEPRA